MSTNVLDVITEVIMTKKKNKAEEKKTMVHHAVDAIYEELNENGFIDFNDNLIRAYLLMCFQSQLIEHYGDKINDKLSEKINEKLKEINKTLN